MKFQIPTLAIVLALKIDECYTPVTAARKSIPEDIESARRRLTSLAKNNSFGGYGKRQNENERLYRVRMGKEFGPLAPFIKIEVQVARNRKKYQAYSGCIYKLAVGEIPLLAATLALCNLLLLHHRRFQQPALPCLGTQPLFPEAVKLLETHRVQYELSEKPSKVDWLRLIPVGALDAVVLWACGININYPSAKPPAQVTAAFLSRLRPSPLPQPAGKLIPIRPRKGETAEHPPSSPELTHLRSTEINHTRGGNSLIPKLIGWAVILVFIAKMATQQTNIKNETPIPSSLISEQAPITPLDKPVQVIHGGEASPPALPYKRPLIPIPMPSVMVTR